LHHQSLQKLMVEIKPEKIQKCLAGYSAKKYLFLLKCD